jgi:molecular chaperone Hsp33
VQLDHPEWEHIQIMGGGISRTELVDPALDLESLVWRLFHEEREVRVEQGPSVVKGCRCSGEYYRSVLARFGVEERQEMRNEEGLILVDCAFCSRIFEIDLD